MYCAGRREASKSFKPDQIACSPPELDHCWMSAMIEDDFGPSRAWRHGYRDRAVEMVTEARRKLNSN